MLGSALSATRPTHWVAAPYLPHAVPARRVPLHARTAPAPPLHRPDRRLATDPRSPTRARRRDHAGALAAPPSSRRLHRRNPAARRRAAPGPLGPRPLHPAAHRGRP